VVDSAERKARAATRVFGDTLRTARWRYTEWGENGRLGRELYDHEKDPREITNLATSAEHAATVRELAQQLRTVVRESHPASGKVPQTKEGHWTPVLLP
jgi:iduronate 2-sulfatase